MIVPALAHIETVGGRELSQTCAYIVIATEFELVMPFVGVLVKRSGGFRSSW